ncbi:hypothetical protein HNY73_003654 [Argiope bruennichi]|uniref:Uncharacterized protein n=1 Tax=Argiope bruennichi TaxID=94029 RepID=A0A8T0FN91_ARGBR|nr:hypothetical protein HNY73_003654 [Argiope bruennichi]
MQMRLIGPFGTTVYSLLEKGTCTSAHNKRTCGSCLISPRYWFGGERRWNEVWGYGDSGMRQIGRWFGGLGRYRLRSTVGRESLLWAVGEGKFLE